MSGVEVAFDYGEWGLDQIRVLYREWDRPCALWGLPHGLRLGQSPTDLYQRRGDLGWRWLGQPGWWGSMDRREQFAILLFLSKHHENVPFGAGEFCVLEAS